MFDRSRGVYARKINEEERPSFRSGPYLIAASLAWFRPTNGVPDALFWPWGGNRAFESSNSFEVDDGAVGYIWRREMSKGGGGNEKRDERITRTR